MKTSKKPYGRQAPGMTVQTVSLDSDVVQFAAKEGRKKGLSLSAHVSEILTQLREQKSTLVP